MHPLRELARDIEELGRRHACWSQVHTQVFVLTDYLCLRARLEELRPLELAAMRKDPK